MSGTDSDSSIIFVGESHKVQVHSVPSQLDITTIPETQERNTVPETPQNRTKILQCSGPGTVPETQGKNFIKNILNTFKKK